MNVSHNFAKIYNDKVLFLNAILTPTRIYVFLFEIKFFELKNIFYDYIYNK
jgi:hypothetical protein